MDPSPPVVPKKGPVVTKTKAKTRPQPTPAPPGTPEQTGDGMLVALSAIHGLSSAKVLKKPFWFQCAPLETMPQDYSWNWDDYATIGSGFHSNPQTATLDTFSFTSLFVDADYRHRFAQVKNVHVLSMVKALKAIGDSLRPFQLNFGQPQLWGVWDVAVAVTMRSLHVEERAGEMDARYFTVAFTEYPDAATHPLAAITPAGSNSKVLQQGVLATLSTAKLSNSMRSLALISKHYYHETSSWRVIAKASGLTKASANEDLRVKYGHMKPPARVIVPELKTAKKK